MARTLSQSETDAGHLLATAIGALLLEIVFKKLHNLERQRDSITEIWQDAIQEPGIEVSGTHKAVKIMKFVARNCKASART